MDIFAKKRFTLWTIILLVVLNISTISMLWLNQKNRPGVPPPLRALRQDQRTLQFLQKELNLTDAQIQQYDQLRQAHAHQTRGLINDIRGLKQKMMDEIFNDEPDSTKAMEIAGLIGEKQTEVERMTFNHFLDLKELCGKDQIGKLKGLIDEFFRSNPPPGQQRPRPSDRIDRPMNQPPGENRNRN